MAATLKYQPHSGLIDRKSYASLYDKTFDEIKTKMENVPREGAEFFSERTTNQETYKEGEMWPNLEVPPNNEDNDRIPLYNPLEGYNKTFTNIARREGFIVTKRSVQSQKTREIAQMLVGLPNAAKKLEELAYASIWNGAFATETGGDGSFLIASDHNFEDPAHGTWTNTASAAAFSTTSYFAAWLSLQQRKDPLGFPNPQIPTAVYYPVALQEAVSKVNGSELYPQNALNAKLDPLFGNFRMKPGHWLTSSTAWFVIGNNDEQDRGLLMVWQDRPDFASISDSMNPDLIMGKRLRMSFSVGGIHGRAIWGNSGA